MTGTLAGALAAREIPVAADKLVAHVEATVEAIDGMPLITKIEVLQADGAERETRRGPARDSGS